MHYLNLMKIKMLKKKLIEFLKTFQIVRTRIVKCELDSVTFWFYLTKKDDLYPFTLNNNFKNYENGSLSYWQDNCKNGIAIDIGAYTGVYSIVASASGATKIYSFEPNKFSREQFVDNIHANNFTNIDVNSNALSSVDGKDFLMMPKIRFHLRPRRNGSGVQLGRSPIVRNINRWQRGQDVIVSTLDSQIPKHLYEKIKVVKIDVEGSELSVLMGATQILAKSQSKLIIESLDNSTTINLVNFLQEFSYKHVLTLSKNLVFEKDQNTNLVSNTPKNL